MKGLAAAASNDDSGRSRGHVFKPRKAFSFVHLLSSPCHQGQVNACLMWCVIENRKQRYGISMRVYIDSLGLDICLADSAAVVDILPPKFGSEIGATPSHRIEALSDKLRLDLGNLRIVATNQSASCEITFFGVFASANIPNHTSYSN